MRPTPQELVEHALATSVSEQCVVMATTSTSANLRWANNTLTTNGRSESIDITVIAFQGRANASVNGTASSPEQVTTLVEQADAAARIAPEAGDFAELLAGPDPTDWQDPPVPTSIEVYADFARELGEEFDRAQREHRILYGFVNHEITTTYLGSSTGMRMRHVQPTGHYSCTGKPIDLSDSAWVGGATRDFTDVSATEMVARLTQRMGWATRRVALPAGHYDTVLAPAAVADLMIDAYWSAGARVAHDGQSVYARPGGGTRMGEQIARTGVQLFSDPAHPGLECAPFAMASSSSNTSSVYDNGISLHRTRWLTDGRLTALVQTRESATLTGEPNTPGIDNLLLSVDGATGTEQDLVTGLEDGLLLTCLWYIREVDPQTLLLTGLTRDGVYRVEGGEITGAVNNFRFNESPISLLRRFSAASATVPSFSREWGDDYFSRTATPALRVPDFNMSSVSQAL